VQWSRSYEQDSPKIIPSPWGLHCRLRVKVRGEVHVIAESLLLNVEVLLLRFAETSWCDFPYGVLFFDPHRATHQSSQVYILARRPIEKSNRITPPMQGSDSTWGMHEWMTDWMNEWVSESGCKSILYCSLRLEFKVIEWVKSTGGCGGFNSVRVLAAILRVWLGRMYLTQLTVSV
jgi:hypothetical protein